MAYFCRDMLLWTGLILLVVVPSWIDASKNPQKCAPGKWFNKKTGVCTVCSACPVNQLIRRPCNPNKDTQCGPFYEFSTFLKGGSGPQVANEEGGMPDYEDDTDDGIQNHEERLQRGQTRNGQGQENNKGAENVVMTVSRYHGYNEEVPSIQDNGEYWKELCFGLIGALSAVLLIVFLYMLIMHFRHRQSMCKNTVEQVTSDDDPHSPYHTVVYHPTSSNDIEGNLSHLQAELSRQNQQSFFQRIFFPQRGNDYIHRITVRDPHPEEEGMPLRVVIPAPAGGIHQLEQPEDGYHTATSRDSGICVNMPASVQL